MQLVDLCGARCGDKGDISNVVVVAYDAALYPHLKEQLTASRFKAFYAGVIAGPVERYTIDHLWMMNFVCQGALGGGVSRSLCLDNYGKTLSAGILGFELEIPQALRGCLRGM